MHPFLIRAFLALLLTPGLTVKDLRAQSAWPRPAGEGYSKITLGGFSSTQYLDLQSQRVQTEPFRSGFASLYAEYGLTDQLTVIGDWPLYRLQGYTHTETITGLGDLRLGLKYGLWEGIFPGAVILMPEFPTGPAERSAQVIDDPGQAIDLPTGDGEFNLHGLLVLSHSFYPAPAYANLWVGYNWRTYYQDIRFQDQLRGGAELGAQLGGPFWARAVLTLQTSLGELPQATDFVRGEGTTFTTLMGGLTWMLAPQWGLDVALQTFLAGPVAPRNIYDSNLLMLGLSYEWGK